MTATPALPPDPLADGGILGYAARLRCGRTTVEAATRDYLARIDALDGQLRAYEHVAHEQALATAAALDALLQAGIDLGPLMGVPVGVKDLLAVDGMPTTAGSNADVRDLVGGEGRFVKRMKRAGCVILGKTATTEFAMSAGRLTRGTPWNPRDAAVHRLPGGSSSGSGVAVAAGLCGFAIGSDTGGSVRIPAALCGTVGLKTTAGLWPVDGVFPMAPTFDTIGLLTRSAADAALAHAVLEGEQPSAHVPAPPPLAALRLAKPDTVFFEALEADVEAAVEAALARLIAGGVTVTPHPVPEASEPATRMAILSPTELLAVLGSERYDSIRDAIDPQIAERIASGLTVTADDYLPRIWRHRELCDVAAERMRGFDAWVTPTCPLTAPPIAELDSPDSGHRFHARVARNTRPGNSFGMCAVTLPLPGPETGLPVGLQIMGVGGTERHILAVSRALEAALGGLAAPDLGRLGTRASPA